MKNVKLILTALVIAATVGACSFTEWDEIVSLEVSPTLYKKTPRVFPGGNVDCSQLNLTGYLQTTGRNDYNPSTDSFTNGWPSGLLVKVDDGKSVSFQIDGAIDLGDGKCYKVGAVIVKGGDASNVYDYTDMGGATMDKGLVPPNNAGGKAAELSNLTFCFVECVEDIYIAVKVVVRRINPETGVNQWYWGLSSGGFYPFPPYWCDRLGVNKFSDGDVYDLVSFQPVKDVVLGNITVEKGDKHIKIIVNASEGVTLHRTYIYAGSLEGLLNTVPDGGKCPDYVNKWNEKVEDDAVGSKTLTFIIPIP